MNKPIKLILIALNMLFITVAAYWAYKTHYDFEPILAVGGFFANIVTLLIDEAVERIKVKDIERSKVNIDKGDNSNISVERVKDGSTINIKKAK